MPDVVDAPTRSRMMSGIRAKDTKPELQIRKRLHALGFRYRLHSRAVPGKPDIVFPGRRAAIFVHGCFWHGHNCPLFREPGTRPEFWRSKIEQNRRRDAVVQRELTEKGWRSITVWECAIRGKDRIGVEKAVALVASWLVTGSGNVEVSSRTEVP